ncbi:hypothetical protein EDC04DRAFT_2910180 [Pisolithus marmoratus]|nr:hypothetical protein EDC04DRAFT_2910180 [Pisolithus marmoratus]
MDHTLKESVEWHIHVQHEVLSLERILSMCQQQDLKMWVPAAASTILEWMVVSGMLWEVLADRIAEINVFKIYPEEVHTVIPKQMPQQWWVDGPTVTAGLGIQPVTESIKEAMEFFQDMESNTPLPSLIILQLPPPLKTFFPGAISEKIKELDNQIHMKGQELYHYEDRLMTIEALTESELVLQGNWSGMVKQRDGDGKQVTKQW